MVDLKAQCICVKFCFKLKKTSLEMHEMLKKLSVIMPWGEHRLWSHFLNSNMEKLVEDCEHSGCPSTGRTNENVE